MAHSMYRKVVHRDSEAMLLNKFKLYIGITIIPAFVTSVCLLAGKQTQQTNKHLFACFLVFLLVACLFAHMCLFACLCTYLLVI